MMERIDRRLLLLADQLVAWCDRRGAADQWELARAFIDISMALMVTSVILTGMTTKTMTISFVLMRVILAACMFWARKTLFKRIAYYSRRPDGGRELRIHDVSGRRFGVTITAILIIINLPDIKSGDIAMLAGFVAMDWSRYVMAALPPPMNRDEQRVRKPLTI